MDLVSDLRVHYDAVDKEIQLSLTQNTSIIRISGDDDLITRR